MTRDTLRSLIDSVDERELDTVYRFLIRLVPEDEILPDEVQAYRDGQRDRQNGDVYSHSEVWDIA